ncbi:mechanosensitive ion channel family protein [Leptolyngbya sp. FACHB-261]|uniref:mechanosensitive ion channel family protein n=1 Tax=Leptolyngbya sp. FACHB-261 TaxID=2692806 RepID=UPI0016839775|nr:mechanosensitive ion channel domain-containing protein [Leptolyngbya sp. FACHB-261]MBD2104625.1 mechanosensitive ion channel [Leptolyngbya sp. FACHB-261]
MSELLLGCGFALLILGIALGLNVLLNQVWRTLERYTEAQVALPTRRYLELAEDIIIWLLRVNLWSVALATAAAQVPPLRPARARVLQVLAELVNQAWGVLTYDFSVGKDTSVSILSLLALVLLALVVFVSSRFLSDLVRDRFLNRLGLERGTQEAAATVLRYLLTVLGLTVLLPSLGINLSSLALLAGTVGIGIGLGLQSISANFISGLTLLFERPIQAGDLIEVDGRLGTVERISVRATTIRTPDNVSVIVPNSRFTESQVVNWSHRNPTCRIHIPVGVAYGSDTRQVEAVLLKVAQGHDQVLKHPVPQAWLRSFGDSALNFELLVWIYNPQDQFRMISDLNYAIDQAFAEAGIQIPFPQRDLNIRSLKLSEEGNLSANSLETAGGLESEPLS